MSYVANGKGVASWVGELPGEWRCNWLKWNVALCKERPTEDQIADLPYISNEDIASWTGKLLNSDPQPAEVDGRLFSRDDVLFNKLRPYLAKAYHAQFNGISSGELLCLRPSEQVISRYLFYVVTSKGFIDTVDSETFGSKMPRADWEIVGHQLLPLPPLASQRRIAGFLDNKTAQIDALIEKKRALLERLAEKRQALITHAVTKGLDSNSLLRNSGVDWLGEIPAHWVVLPVKRAAELQSGHTPDKKIDAYWDDCDIPWVSLNDTATLRANDYISETAFSINELGLANSSARLLPRRAVVFTRDATIGESAITTRPMAVSQHIIAWLCNEELVIPEFLLFAIYGMTTELMRLTNGSTIKTIGLSDVKKIRVALPPIEEQKRIVSYVFEGKAQLDQASEQIETSIDRLVEYRRAMIVAAVTGDVRVEQ